MRYEDFITEFNRQVFELNLNRQFELALCVCKKLYFDYQNFTVEHKWGNSETLFDIITTIEQTQIGNPNKEFIQKAFADINQIIPSDDFNDEISCYAINACIVVSKTLEFLLDNKAIHIYEIGIRFTDSIDFKIQEEGELTEEEIDINPNMIQARNFLVEASK